MKIPLPKWRSHNSAHRLTLFPFPTEGHFYRTGLKYRKPVPERQKLLATSKEVHGYQLPEGKARDSPLAKLRTPEKNTTKAIK